MPSLGECRSSIRGAEAPSASIISADCLSRASSHNTPAETRFMFSTYEYRSWRQKERNKMTERSFVLGKACLLNREFNRSWQRGVTQKTHTRKQHPGSMRLSSTPTHHNTRRGSSFTARNAVILFSTCTNRGIVCMLAISPRLIGSLARMCKAPVHPSTISSIRTPSCGDRGENVFIRDYRDAYRCLMYCMAGTETLMLIGLCFGLPLGALL